MEDICTGCLCSGRKLHFIGETNFYQLYYQILNEISVNTSQIFIRICWECCALLRKFERFKAQVKRNHTELLWNSLPLPQSTLKTTVVFNLSYPESLVHRPIQLTDIIKEEGQEEIKVETEDQLELFVNNLPLAENGVDEPTKKSKKKSKLNKSRKSNAKVKKTKKSSLVKNTQELTETRELPETRELAGTREFPETREVPEAQELATQELPETREFLPSQELPETRELPEITNSDGVSDTDMPEDNFQDDDDDKPLKNVKQDKIDSKMKEVNVNGVKKVSKPKPVLPAKSAANLLPDKPQCAECGKTFSSRKTYRYHLNVLHKGNNQYPCPRCGKIYQWKSNLGRHMRTHKAVDDGELYCEECDKSFASVATYRQHLRISRRHVSENEFSFTCNECGKKFVSKTRLRDHIDWDHLKKIKFRCQLCNKPFKCHTSLYVHLQNVHRNKEKKDNLCHVCGKSYQNAAKLKYHIIALHTGETPYQCSQCSAAFGWYSSLYRHIREVHYKVKSQPKKSKKAKKIDMDPPPYLNYHP